MGSGFAAEFVIGAGQDPLAPLLAKREQGRNVPHILGAGIAAPSHFRRIPSG